MKEILKPLFEIITGEVAVCDNVIYNYFVMIVVGEIAFQLAYDVVGRGYRSGDIQGKAAGSLLHWGIRLILYVVIAYVLRGILWLNAVIKGIPSWVWWLLFGGGVLAIGIVAVVILWKREKEE